MCFGLGHVLLVADPEKAELLLQGREGGGAPEQPLIDLDLLYRLCRVKRTVCFCRKVLQDRTGLEEGDGLSARAVVIDDGGDFMARINLQIFRLHVLPLRQFDESDGVIDAGLLNAHARLVAVIGGPEI